MHVTLRNRNSVVVLFLIAGYVCTTNSVTSDALGQESCFCRLRGEINDCSCNVESLDLFNNQKIYPLIINLLERDYFKFFQVNLFRSCPFKDSTIGQCGLRSCAVDECNEDQLPAGLKRHERNKYLKEENEGERETSICNDENTEFSQLNSMIGADEQKNLEEWRKYDEKRYGFCELDDESSPDSVYYNLLLNPERFTGYAGPAAVNMWKHIYNQNCFKQDDYPRYGVMPSGLCLEMRTFYRLISGFHASVNIHVAADYLISGRTAFEAPYWGPSLEEFVRRFDPELTEGEGPKRLRNLYFAYLVELRALAKAAPYLSQEMFHTGNENEDIEVRHKVQELLNIIKQAKFHFMYCVLCRSFSNHFDEGKLFQDNQQNLLDEFRVHFRNITRIMDCVGCDKCRLWGKLQITGMAVALKILFSEEPHVSSSGSHQLPFRLTRNEIVALFNAFGRLSNSIHNIERFRVMLGS